MYTKLSTYRVKSTPGKPVISAVLILLSEYSQTALYIYNANAEYSHLKEGKFYILMGYEGVHCFYTKVLLFPRSKIER